MAPRDSDVFVEYGGISASEPSRSTSRTVLVLVSPEAPARAYPLGRRSVPEVCVLLRDGVNLAAGLQNESLVGRWKTDAAGWRPSQRTERLERRTGVPRSTVRPFSCLHP